MLALSPPSELQLRLTAWSIEKVSFLSFCRDKSPLGILLYLATYIPFLQLVANPHNPQLSSTESMISCNNSNKVEALNITCHQLTPPTTMVVSVPVRPMNRTRPFLRGRLSSLIDNALRKTGSGHARLCRFAVTRT